MFAIILTVLLWIITITMSIPLIRRSVRDKGKMSFKEWCEEYAMHCWLWGVMLFLCIGLSLGVFGVLNNFINKVLVTFFWADIDLLLIIVYYICPITDYVDDNLDKWTWRIIMALMLCLPLIMIVMIWIID